MWDTCIDVFYIEVSSLMHKASKYSPHKELASRNCSKVASSISIACINSPILSTSTALNILNAACIGPTSCAFTTSSKLLSGYLKITTLRKWCEFFTASQLKESDKEYTKHEPRRFVKISLWRRTIGSDYKPPRKEGLNCKGKIESNAGDLNHQNSSYRTKDVTLTLCSKCNLR